MVKIPRSFTARAEAWAFLIRIRRPALAASVPPFCPLPCVRRSGSGGGASPSLPGGEPWGHGFRRLGPGRCFAVVAAGRRAHLCVRFWMAAGLRPEGPGSIAPDPVQPLPAQPSRKDPRPQVPATHPRSRGATPPIGGATPPIHPTRPGRSAAEPAALTPPQPCGSRSLQFAGVPPLTPSDSPPV